MNRRVAFKILICILIILFMFIKLNKLFYKGSDDVQSSKDKKCKGKDTSPQNSKSNNQKNEPSNQDNKISNQDEILKSSETKEDVTFEYFFSESDYNYTNNILYPENQQRVEYNSIDPKLYAFLYQMISTKENIVRIFILCDYIIDTMPLNNISNLVVGINEDKSQRKLGTRNIYALSIILQNFNKSLFGSKFNIIRTIKSRIKMYGGFNTEKKIRLSKYQIFLITNNKKFVQNLSEFHKYILGEEIMDEIIKEYLVTDYMKISPLEFIFTTLFDFYLHYLKEV